MSDWRKPAVMMALAVSLVAAALTGCGREAAPDADEGILDELAAELGARQCVRTLDSLAFRMQGILFEAEVDITDREAVMALVPYPLPVCPVSGDTYQVTDEGYVLVFTCPSGHGSVEVD